MEERQVPVLSLVTPSYWGQQHTGTEQGVGWGVPSFPMERQCRLKSRAFSQVLVLGFWQSASSPLFLLRIGSFLEQKTAGAAMLCSSVLYGLELSPKTLWLLRAVTPRRDCVRRNLSVEVCHQRQGRCVRHLCGWASDYCGNKFDF